MDYDFSTMDVFLFFCSFSFFSLYQLWCNASIENGGHLFSIFPIELDTLEVMS